MVESLRSIQGAVGSLPTMHRVSDTPVFQHPGKENRDQKFKATLFWAAGDLVSEKEGGGEKGERKVGEKEGKKAKAPKLAMVA